jgi:Tol biopolymer transport system component/DNA-binding winged helix-turn-helix (wHTH) protein
MGITPSGSQVVRFGDFTLDLRSGELLQNGGRLLLSEQPFRILALMVRQPGTLITRDDLRRVLWPEDTFVDFEHSLNAAIKRLREALGDSATTPRFIETLPRRGYRFIGELDAEPITAAQGETATLPTAKLEPTADAKRRTDRLPRWWIVGASVAAIVVAILFASARLPSPFRADGAPDLIRLTSTSGLNIDPALSPDGSLLAYASDRGGAGGFDVWVQPVGGADSLRLTNDSADEAEPSFSPDGSEIVFSRRDTGLYVIGALGGHPRLVARARWARTPRFSPDGKWIAYWTGLPASVIAGGIPGALGSILVVPSGGGSPRLLQLRVASARYPVWSPAGDRILFLGEENTDEKRFDWYVTGRDGTDLIKTGAVPAIRAAGLRAGPPIPGSWSTRGNVVFSTNETDSSNVWEISISLETGRASAAPRRLTFGTAIERSPAAAPSGRIVFASIAENVDVWRVPVDAGTGVATGALERVTDSAASDRLRNVSADGKTLAFISSRTKQDEVWLRDVESGTERQVTHAGAGDATLSPNGSRIAFSRVDAGVSQIDMVDATGSPPSSMCKDCDIPADWSPDGSRLLFGKGLPSRLLVYDVPSGRTTELASHPKWNLHQARFSPDGQWVAFHTTNSPNVRQIYAVRSSLARALEPQSWVALVTDHGCHPNWSPDGSLLYHFSFRDGAFCPWVQRMDPVTKRPIGQPRAVLHLHEPRLRATSGASASNDVQAGYLYMTATEATGNIWMLESGKR